MAIDLSTISTFPHHRKVTLSGTPTTVTRITLPTGVEVKVSVNPVGAAACFVLDTTVADATTVTVADHPPVPADQWTELKVCPEPESGVAAAASVALASSTASHVIHVVLEAS